MALRELFVAFKADTSQVQQSIKSLNKDVDKTIQKFNKAADRIGAFGRKATLFLTTPLLGFQTASTLATAEMEGLNATLTSVLKNMGTTLPITEAVTNEFEFMKKTANELGISLQSIQKPYVKYLAASKDSLQETRKVARAFIALGSALNITPSDMNRVIRAIEQMQSKGQVMSEELKLQLGDVVPGAVKLFAKAMGVTTEEFLELSKQGKVSSAILSDVADVINRDFKEAIRLGSQSTRSQLNRLSTGFFVLRNSVGKASEEVFGIRDKLGRFGEWLTNTAGDLDKLNLSGKKTLFWFGAFLAILGPGAIAIQLIARAFMIWRGALLFLFTPFTKLLLLIPLATKAFRLLFLVLRANPLFSFVTLTLLILQNWEKIVDVFIKAKNAIKGFFSSSNQPKPTKKLFKLGPVEEDYETTPAKFGTLSDVYRKATSGATDFNRFLDKSLTGGAIERLLFQDRRPSGNSNNSNNTINQNLTFAPGTSSKDKDAIKGAITEANQDIMKNMLFQARLQE